MTRYLTLFAAAAALSGCASMNAPQQQTASLQGAVYKPANGQAAATSDVAAAAVPGAPKQMRIYWFLGGR
jgi:hypothetical protein